MHRDEIPTPALLLDLDRCRVYPPGVMGQPDAMIARLSRSLRQHARRTGRQLAPREWQALDAAARAAAWV